jgi:hypothetical protein
MSDLLRTPGRLFFASLVGLLVALPTSTPAQAQTPGIRIAWDYRTIIRAGGRAGDYARMERIGDSDTLAIAFGYGNFKLSYDNGKTWPTFVGGAVRDTFPTAHPYNVELTYLDNGTLLLPYNYRSYGADGIPIHIRVNASTDGGKTWDQRAALGKAGDTPGNGIYEPAIIQLPNGDLQLYAATEEPYRGPQGIIMFESTDNGHTWSEGEIVSFRGTRDGMPAPLLLNDDKGIAVAIEDNGWPGCSGGKFRPTVLHSPSANPSWQNAPIGQGSDFVPRYRDKALASQSQLACSESGPAPYLAQFPQGETVLSFQSNTAPFEPREEIKQTMVVAIGDDEAREFTSRSYPYGNPKRPAGSNDPDNCGNGVCGVAAIWNSLFVKDSTTITAVTSTGAGFRGQQPNGTYLMDGYRIPEPVAHEVPSGVTMDGQLDEAVWQNAHSTFIGARSPMNGTFHPTWDEDNLYLACDVSDPSMWVEDGNPRNSDGCSFELSPRANGLFRVMVSATGDVLLERKRIRDWETWDAAGVEVAADTTGELGQTGSDPEQFSVEVAIPWSEIGGQPIPQRGLGINYGMSHRFSLGRDYYKEYVSGNDPDRQQTWQRVTLGDPATDAEPTAGAALPDEMQITSYPNPFRRQATVEYALPEAGEVTLAVYDVLGRKVETVTRRRRSAGRHEAKLAAEGWPAGVYVVRLTSSTGASKTRTVTLLR